MGCHTNMRNHLHTLMKRRTSWNYAKTLDGRAEWVYDLVPWSWSSNRVNRGLKYWVGLGDSGAEKRLTVRIRSHMLVENIAPWVGPHFRRKLVMIFGRGIEQESSKRLDMDVLASRLFLEQSKLSNVSYSR